MLQISQAIQCIMVAFYVKHYGYKDCDPNMLEGHALHTVATCKRKTTKETLKNLLHCQDTSTIVRTMVKKRSNDGRFII